MISRGLVLVSVISAITLAPQSGIAKPPAGLADLLGMRGSSLENEMSNRGYSFVKAPGAQFWWNGDRKICVSLSISNGRVSRIDTVANAQCGKGGALAGGGSGLAGIAGMNSISAIDAMTARGFVNVDSLESGNTQYGIFFNRKTRLCAQLTMADGKVLDARDIRTHPKCR